MLKHYLSLLTQITGQSQAKLIKPFNPQMPEKLAL